MLAVLLIVCLNGLSRSIETFDPQRAFHINPLNTDARVNWLMDKLNGEKPAAENDQLVEVAEEGLTLTPLDARLYSLRAELLLRAGDEAEADRLFRQANRLSHTENLALRYLINRLIEVHNFPGAIAQIDMLLRRWPDQTDAVLPVIPYLLSDDPAYQTFLKAMTDDVPWRSRLISGLSRQNDGLTLVYRVLMDLSASSHPPSQGEIASGIRAFMTSKRYDDAYRLFRFTMPEEGRRMAGFIQNSTFSSDVSGISPFSWVRRNTRAAEIQFSGETGPKGATVRFFGTPAKDITLNQSLVLPEGRYRLVVEAEASSLHAPRGLYWRVLCQDPRRDLVRLEIPDGTYKSRQLETSFNVSECGFQRIELMTDVIAESWQNRYTGLVRFGSVKIERLDLVQAQD